MGKNEILKAIKQNPTLKAFSRELGFMLVRTFLYGVAVGITIAVLVFWVAGIIP